MEVWGKVLVAHTLVNGRTRCQDTTLINDWTAQKQAVAPNPVLAQEQAAQWQLLHQHFQHLQYQQQLAASSNLEPRQKFQHPGEDVESIGGQSSMGTRMDQTGV